MKREFLMLAQTYNPSKHAIGGWFMSEKLDGMRCFWDGGVSTGMLKKDVPWSNTDKDKRYLEPPVATGLWTRLGNVIHAPEEWLRQLPPMPLDGELYLRGYRQDLMSIVKRLHGSPSDWRDIKLHAFDIPCLGTVFEGGYLNSTNFTNKTIDEGACRSLILGSSVKFKYDPFKHRTFHTTQVLIERMCPGTSASHLYQERLPLMQRRAQGRLMEMLNTVADNGGEGIMLRNPDSAWEAHRSWQLLKVKRLDDAEGTVVGYVTGRETDKGSKLLGMMGALVLDYGGKRLELSGFTEAERVLGPVSSENRVTRVGGLTTQDTEALRIASNYTSSKVQSWATQNPETECPDWIQAKHFPRGTVVTFRYRGESKDGIPQEARYWRKHVSS